MRNAAKLTLSALAAAAVVAVGGLPAQAGGDYMAEEPAGFRLAIGGAVGVKPVYEGSDEYEAYGIPLIIPQFGGGFGSRLDVRGVDDVRIGLIQLDAAVPNGLVLGPVLGYRFERDQTDARLLRGLGDVDGGFVGGVFASYDLGVVSVDAAYKHQFGDDDPGYLVDFGATAKGVIGPGLTMTARLGATYADDDYMQTFFGVTAAQAATSVAGLPAYNADGGLKDVYLQLGAKAELSDQWTVRGSVRYSKLLGDAADSPIVASEDQFSGMIGATYSFPLQ